MRAAPLIVALATLLTTACGDQGGEMTKDQSLPAIGSVSRQDMAVSPEEAGNAVGAVGGAASAASVRTAAPPSPPRAPGMEPSEQLPTQSVAPSMVIRTGDARVEVDSLEIAIAKLQDLARQLGGFVGNTSMQVGERELRQATVELKVPAERFEAAQAGLAAVGKVEFVNVTAQDVGEEFVDVTARVENARRLEQRLITLLATRTGRLEEVLSVERELARIRETIERYEGRLRYLRTRVAVSTFMVTVHEEEPLVGQLGTGSRIGEAFRNMWRNFVASVAWLIESLGVLIPVGVIAALVIWAAARYRASHPRPPVPPRPPAPPHAG